MKAIVLLLAMATWLPSLSVAQDLPPEKLKYQADMPEGEEIVGYVKEIVLLNGTVFAMPAMIYKFDDKGIAFRVPPKIKGFMVPWSDIKSPKKEDIAKEMAAYAEDQAKRKSKSEALIASYKPSDAGYYMQARPKEFEGKRIVLNCSSVHEIKTVQKNPFVDFIVVTPGAGNKSTMMVRVPNSNAEKFRDEYGSDSKNKSTKPLPVIFKSNQEGAILASK